MCSLLFNGAHRDRFTLTQSVLASLASTSVLLQPPPNKDKGARVAQTPARRHAPRMPPRPPPAPALEAAKAATAASSSAAAVGAASFGGSRTVYDSEEPATEDLSFPFASSIHDER